MLGRATDGKRTRTGGAPVAPQSGPGLIAAVGRHAPALPPWAATLPRDAAQLPQGGEPMRKCAVRAVWLGRAGVLPEAALKRRPPAESWTDAEQKSSPRGVAVESVGGLTGGRGSIARRLLSLWSSRTAWSDWTHWTHETHWTHWTHWTHENARCDRSDAEQAADGFSARSDGMRTALLTVN